MNFDLPFTEDVGYRFDSLYQWLNRKYRLEEIDQRIGERTFRLFKIKDIEEVLDEVIENSPRPDEDAPYWTDLWPSSIALAQFVNREVEFWNKTVIELGCGLGFVSIVAHQCGADVLLTDIEEDALRMAELNWIVNFSAIPHLSRIDWRNPAINQKFDIILGSDLAYEERLFWPLIDIFRRLLAPAGTIYLSEPNRPIAEPFFESLQSQGFMLEKNVEPVRSDSKTIHISVYRIRIER